MKFLFLPQRKGLVAIIFIAVFLVAGISYLSLYSSQVRTPFRRAPTSSTAVLAAEAKTGIPDNLFQVNFPTEFTNTVTFDKNALLNSDIDVKGKATFDQGIATNNQNIVTGTGQVLAPNLLYGITAGNGIGVTNGQTPTITNTGVTSLQGATGAVILTAGDGISISGTTISSTASSDTGSSQNIFKNILVSGQSSITAGNNNDSLEFVAGTGIVLTTNAGNKQVSIASTGGGATSQWTTSGSDIYYTGGNVGIGTTTPLYPLDITGDAHVTGNLVLGATSVSSLTGNGLTVTGGSLGISLPASGATSSTTSSFSGLEFSGSQLSLIQGCNDTQLLKWDLSLKQWICSNDLGGATSVINIQNSDVSYSGVDTVNFLKPDFIASKSGATANVSIDYAGGHIAQTNQPEVILDNWTFNNGVISTNLNLTNTTNQISLGSGNIGTISLATLTGNHTYTFPDATGTVCLTSGNCIGGGGGLGGSGITNFIAKFTPDGNHAGNSSIFDNGQVDIGSINPIGLFNVDGSQTGKALVVFNQTGDQNILTASASGMTRLTLDTAGNLNIIGGGYAIGGTTVLSPTTLGTGILTSSLTTVGSLASGSIVNGFGTISTGSTITGTTVNGTTGINTGAGTGTARIDSTGNLVNITGLSSNLTPTSTNTYSIGTGTGNQLANIYSNAIFQNGSQVCDVSGNCTAAIGSSVNFWNITGGALSPKNTTLDLLIGGESTDSAKFAFINVSSGTPTASIAGITGSIYLTGNGNLATTNNQSLLIGGGSTGNIVLSGFSSGVLHSTSGVLSTGQVTNVELQNSGITINNGTGITGGGLVSLGGALTISNSGVTSAIAGAGIGVSGSTGDITFSNTGVTSITGTANQIIASSGTGAINLSLPQDINSTATPIFNSLLLSGGNTGGNATEIINQTGAATNDILVASASGITEFRIDNSGNILPGINGTQSIGAPGLVYNAIYGTNFFSGANAGVTLGSASCVMTSGGIVTGSATCPGGSISPFVSVSGTILEGNTTQDLLLGGTSTTSAKFAFLNTNTGIPTASISGGTTGGVYLTAAGNLGTTDNQSLTLGGAGTGNIILSGVGTGVVHSTNGILSTNAVTNAELQDSSVTINTGTGLSGGGLLSLGGTLSLANSGVVSITGTTNQIIASSGAGAIILSLPQSIDTSALPTFAGETLATLNGNNAVVYGTTATGVLTSASTNTAGLCLQSGTSAPTWGSCSAGFVATSSPFQSVGGIIQESNTTQDFLLGGIATSSATFAVINIAGAAPIATLSATAAGTGLALSSDGSIQSLNKGTLTVGGSTTGNVIINPNSGSKVGIGTASPSGLLSLGEDLAGAPSTNGVYLAIAPSTFTDTVTTSSGTLNLMAFTAIGAPTLSSANTSVTTNHAATVAIAGAPQTGANERIQNPYALDVQSGNSAFGGGINLTGSSNTTIGTAVEGLWPLNGNTYTYKDTMNVANTDVGTLPIGYEVTVVLAGNQAALIYNNSRADNQDFRIAYNGTTEIARNVTTFNNTSVIFTFQLQATIGVGTSSTAYSIIYDNPTVSSGAPTYIAGFQYDSLDAITGNWVSSDQIQFPVSQETSTTFEGTGSMKTIATVDNVATFSATSQNPLDAAISNFGFGSTAVGTTNYMYTLGGSTDGTAVNARATVYRTSLNGTTGNVNAGTANANSLPSPLMDNAVALFIPPVNSGTGVDGPLDLSKGRTTGGCMGQGLSWSGSTCTIISHPTAVIGPQLGATITSGSHSISIPTGPNSGKRLIIVGGSSQTEIYDPSTNTFSTGPDIGATVTTGSHSFVIPSGSNANKILTVVSNSSGATEIYDPSTNTYSAGPALGANAGAGSHSFTIPSGSNAGKILTVVGNATTTTRIFDPSTNTYGTGPALPLASGLGAHSFLIPSGSNAGKILTVLGGDAGNTSMYDPSTNTYSVGPAVGAVVWVAGGSFLIPSGSNAGKILTMVGGNTGTTEIYDPSTNTYSAGPAIGANLYDGGNFFTIPSGSNAGKILVAVGATFGGSTTRIYDPSSNTFSVGPDAGQAIYDGSNSFQVPSGPQAGKIIMLVSVFGATVPTQIYDPSANTFSAGPSLGSVSATGAGSNSFAIAAGSDLGDILTIVGGGITQTDLYVASTSSYTNGPALGASAGAGSHSFTIPSGSNAGKTLVVLGGTTGNTQIFDPATSTFSTGPALGANATTGAHSFTIPSGSNAGKILTVVGGTTTRIFDPSTSTYGAGPALGTSAGIGSHSFTIPSGSNAGKILTVVGGSGSSTYLYDPSSNTYSAGPNIGAAITSGAHSIQIPSGSNAGKILTIVGGSSTTRIFDPSTSTYGAGPALPANVGDGANSILLTSGGSIGKIFTILANGPNTAIYDPATNLYTSGLGTISSLGAAGHTILITSGINAGKYLLVAGGSSNFTNILDAGKQVFNFTTINIPSSTTLTSDLPFSDNTAPHIATLSATGNVIIAGTINLVGLGYAGVLNGLGFGPGGSNSPNNVGCGGSYIGAGGAGARACTVGSTYTQDDAGSAGGGSFQSGPGSPGGAGGGAIAINSNGTITITGTGSIDADGQLGPLNGSFGSGGGSGGLIHLTAPTIINNGTLSARGGAAQSAGGGAGGGGGGGGKVLLSYTTSVTSGTISTAGGTVSLGGGTAGTASTFSTQSNPPTIYSFGGQNTSGTAQATISQAGVTFSDGSIGTFSSTANPLPQALYGLTATTVASGSSVYLYAIGGNNGTSDQTTVYNIPVSSTGVLGVGTTTGQAQLSTGISHHATVTGTIGGNNYIWVIGGENGITGQNTIYKGTINNVGNIASLTTSGQATLPTPLYSEQAFFQTVGNNNYIYILGGMTTGGTKQTAVYKATLDGNGNVTSVTTLGQYPLGTAISNFGVANFTDNSGNNDAYIFGGFTTGTQSTIQKALINSDQTGYIVARTNFSPTDLSNMNDITFWVNASLAGTYMTMDINTGTSGSPNWQQCNFNSAPNFTIPSTNTWDRIDCNITPISGRTAVTGLRVRVATSQTQLFTTYFDDFEAKTSASTLTSSALVLAASLGNANLDLNGQGNGSVNINYDPTNALAGTGGFTVYNGGTTPLMTLTSIGSLGLNTATPAATLNVWGNSGTTPVASFSGKTAAAALVVDNSGTGDLFTASSSGVTRFVISQLGNINTTGSASIAGALTFAGTPIIQSTNNQSLTLGGATTGTIIFNPQNSTAGAQLLPGANGTVDIGSPTLAFRNLYVNSIFAASSSGIFGFIQKNLGALASNNITDDFLIGSAATTSATVRLPGLLNQNAFFNLGTGNFGIGTNNPVMATLDVRGNNANLPGEFIAANTAAAGLIVNNAGTGNLFTASTSGTAKFTIANNGNIGVVAGGSIDTLTAGTLSIAGSSTTTLSLGRSGQTINLPGYASGNNSVLYADSTANGVLSKVNTSVLGQCLTSGATTPAWGPCGTTSPFIMSGGTVQELNNTQDLLLGGTSTISAKFAVININSGTPVASLSAGTNGGLSVSANGTIATTANQSLTLGTAGTGNIVLNPSSQAIVNGVLSVTGAVNAQGALNVSGLLTASNGMNVTGSVLATGTVSGQMVLQNGNQVCDASGNCNQGTKWTQSDWSGGSGQTSFAVANQYSSGTNILTSTPNQVSLTTNEKFVNNNFAVDTSSWTAIGTVSANTVSYYKMDEASGSTVADSAGINTGTATGTTVVAGKINNGRSFNGSTDTISLGNDASLEFAGDFSIGAWVFENAAGTGEIVQKGTSAFAGGGAGTDYEFGFVGGTLYFQMHGANGVAVNGLNTTSVTTGAWHYITAVFKSSTSATIYVDGVQQATTATTVNHTETSTGIARIGSGPALYFFNGKIDEVGLWSRALSPFDIATIYNAGTGLQYPFAGTVIRNTTTTYNGTAASAQVTGGGMTQSVTTGDTNKYNLIAFAFTDGSAITAANTQLIANGAPVTTTYTSVGGGWYELSGIVTGSISAVPYGVTVSTGQTVYFDGLSLSNYTTSGTLTSSIFDTGQANVKWQAMTYTGITPTNTSLAVKLITSNSSTLAGAPAYTTCTAIASGISPTATNTNGCVNNNNRYVQYQVSFSTTDTSLTPLLTAISIGYGVSVANLLVQNGAVYNADTTQDFLLGGTSTASAEFGVLNIATGTPIASIAGRLNGGVYLTALGNLATTNNQSLTLGGATSGNIILLPSNGTGFVGINDTDPTNTLKVKGSLCVSANTGACSGNTIGTIYADNTTITGADVAENYVSSQTLLPGDVVVMSNDGNNNVIIKATTPNQTTLLGVISTKPGVTVNSGAHVDNVHPNLYPVALVGRVPVKVSSSNGTISVGDALTSSSTPGIAVKATQPGMIIGRALEAYTDTKSSDIGTILAYTNVSWYDPTSFVSANGNVLASSMPAGGTPLATDSALLISSLGQQVTTLQLQGTQQNEAIASLSAQLNSLQDTVTFLSTESGVLNKLVTVPLSDSMLNSATMSGDLTVMGKTLLNKLDVTGNITAGLLTINGLNGTIDTIGQPLQLQSEGVSPIELEEKNVMIATNGDITTTGQISAKEVTTGKLNILNQDLLGASVGQAVLPAGQISIIIKTSTVTPDSQIFLTPQLPLDFSLGVTSKVARTSFTVTSFKKFSQDIKFSWWVIN